MEWYFQWANLVLVGRGDEQDQLVQHVPLDLPAFDLPAPQLHQPQDGHLPEVRPRGGRQIRVRNRRGGRAGRGRGQGPEQEPVQEPPVQDPPVQGLPVQEPPVQEPPIQKPPMHPSETGPSHGIAHGSPTDWCHSFIGDPQAGSSAQAVAFTPLSLQAPRRVDDTTSSESASHDAPGDDPHRVEAAELDVLQPVAQGVALRPDADFLQPYNLGKYTESYQ
ncbi:hypothetical protein PIB30_096893, partial [Stylosanthes scabra]|nr:hypothetical protein [Stylosanthes scabra]